MTLRALIIGDDCATSRAGGLNRYVDDLATALKGIGARPTPVVIGADPAATASAGSPAPRWPLPARVAAMRRAAARGARGADVVDAHFALYAVAPLLTTRLRRLPLVVHFHGPWADESTVGRGQRGAVVATKRALERIVYRRAEAVVALSAHFGQVAVERYGVDPSRVAVVPPGVDLARFRLGDRTAARTRFAVCDRSLVAVSVRRLDARMGLDVLVEAWGKVQSARPDAVLLIAGEGRERDRLEAARDRLNDPSGVRLLGAVTDDELTALYQAADVSVVPSRALEGFGLVTLESLACGTPPVVTDVGGLPDGVRGLDPSLVVPAEDAEALAGRILTAAAGAAPSRAACRAHAQTFAWNEVARRHVEIYRGAMGERPLRVAYIGHTASLSGAELALGRVLPSLQAVDARVILGEDGPLVDRLRRAGLSVEVLDMGERARSVRKASVVPRRLPLRAVVDTVRYSVRLARRLRRLRPDVVHTNSLKAALYGGVAGRLAGIPVVCHVHDRISPDYLPRPAVALVRLAARLLPATVIANSHATLTTLGRWPSRAVVVPNATITAPAAEAAGAPRGGDRPFTVGLVGRLTPWKGQDIFLRAFARAFPDGGARARIVGSALFGEEDWAASLAPMAADLGIGDRVDFVGFVDDMPAEYARLDVLVHASTIPEPFGQVVVEGLAAGLPVVAAGAGGPAEIVTDGIDGLLYPIGDVSALADRLRRLADDDDLRARLGAAGRSRAAAFAPPSVAAALEAVYRNVVIARRICAG
jgi:glycosyltransferase involved in cell wall biosynthesis